MMNQSRLPLSLLLSLRHLCRYLSMQCTCSSNVQYGQATIELDSDSRAWIDTIVVRSCGRVDDLRKTFARGHAKELSCSIKSIAIQRDAIFLLPEPVLRAALETKVCMSLCVCVYVCVLSESESESVTPMDWAAMDILCGFPQSSSPEAWGMSIS